MEHESIDARLTDWAALMEAIAEPDHLYCLKVFHDDGCPSLGGGGALQDCNCAYQLKLETWAIVTEET